jgi:hypothetical protein
MKLFRYRNASENTLAELAEKKAWYSRYDQLNDPFEGVYVNLSGEGFLDDLIQQFRLCCFSTHRDSLLLWAHYADNHRGICLEYELPEEVFRTQFFPVKYSDVQPVLNNVNRDPAAGTLSIHIDREAAVFLTKSTDWAYEGEYRTLRLAEQPDSRGEKHALPGTLSAVYFGLRAERAAMMLVEKILHSRPEVTLSQASLVTGRFQLHFTPVERSGGCAAP